MWSSPPSSRSSSLNQSPARFEVSDSNVSMAKWPVCRERRDKRSQLKSKPSDVSGHWHLSPQCTAAASRTVSCICTSWMTVERWYKMEALDCKRLTPKPDIYCRCLDHKRSSAQRSCSKYLDTRGRLWFIVTEELLKEYHESELLAPRCNRLSVSRLFHRDIICSRHWVHGIKMIQCGD